jgi:phosphotransferase system  glucose/maltose/N-acetylglucosamine-specific IIC component
MFTFMVNVMLYFGICSSLHNIDLAYNSENGLIDCEDIEVICQRSYANLLILFPITIGFTLLLGFLWGDYEK